MAAHSGILYLPAEEENQVSSPCGHLSPYLRRPQARWYQLTMKGKPHFLLTSILAQDKDGCEITHILLTLEKIKIWIIDFTLLTDVVSLDMTMENSTF